MRDTVRTLDIFGINSELNAAPSSSFNQKSESKRQRRGSGGDGTPDVLPEVGYASRTVSFEEQAVQDVGGN
jgi:hypothetical protein